MISVARFDPASLTVWYDQELINQSPDFEEFAPPVYYSLEGNSSQLSESLQNISEERTRLKCIHLVGSMLHEKRHFVDFVLTNHGAFRVRQFFQLYVNAGSVFSDSEDPDSALVCPLDVYTDPVRSQVLQVPPASRNAAALARDMGTYKETLIEDLWTFDVDEGTVRVGGEAQLESLAFFSQMSAIQNLFGYDSSLLAQQDLMEKQWGNLRYKWAQVLLARLNLLPSFKVKEGLAALDVGPLCVIVFASLMQRAWRQDKSASDIGSAGLPVNRLGGFLNKLQRRSEDLHWAPIADVWEIVNDTAKQLYGRTILEEVAADYAHEEAWCEAIVSSEGVADEIKRAVRDYHRLRGELINVLEDNPEAIIDPEHFVKDLAFRVRPLPIYTAGSGQLGDPPEGYELLFGFRDPESNTRESKWWWAAVPQDWPPDDPAVLTLRDRRAWCLIAEQFAPLAKLLLNGRKHELMLGPELINIEKRLENQGTMMRFDPLFEFPAEGENLEASDDIDSYFWLTGKTEAVCDLCSARITRPSGHLVSPWFFRRYESIGRELIEENLGGGYLGWLRFWRDWSPWVVCDNDYARLSEAALQD